MVFIQTLLPKAENFQNVLYLVLYELLNVQSIFIFESIC